MSEYTVVGGPPVAKLLKNLLPHLRLKKAQAELALSILERMPSSGREMTAKKLVALATEVDAFATLNYSKKRKNTAAVVKQFLQVHGLLDPVETDS